MAVLGAEEGATVSSHTGEMRERETERAPLAWGSSGGTTLFAHLENGHSHTPCVADGPRGVGVTRPRPDHLLVPAGRNHEHMGLLQAHDDSPGLILGESREEGVYLFFFLLASSSHMASYRQPPQPSPGGLALSLSSQPCELLVVVTPLGEPGPHVRWTVSYSGTVLLAVQWSHLPLQHLARLD